MSIHHVNFLPTSIIGLFPTYTTKTSTLSQCGATPTYTTERDGFPTWINDNTMYIHVNPISCSQSPKHK